MTTKVKIIQAGGLIDFYVDKKRFEKFKTKYSKFNYVKKELDKCLEVNIGKTINNIEIRDMFITSNNFWKEEDILTVNDIGYGIANQLPLNNDQVTVRIFNIELIGILTKDYDETDPWLTIIRDSFQFDMSSRKII